MSPVDAAVSAYAFSFPRVSGDEPEVRVLTCDGFRFPRVSGDEPMASLSLQSPYQFSPRERG